MLNFNMKATGYNSKASWFAMLAVTVLVFLISIPFRLLGLFFVIIFDNYNVSREEALIPIVTYGTLRTLSGPLVGYLGETFGLQKIIIIGCILVCLGLGLSCLTNDIVSLTICLGLIYGTGFSLSNNLTSCVIRQHFTEYFSLTTGILLTVSALGSTIMTPVINYLMNVYGTKGMFLILSGIFMHTIPAALFLKNPKNEERENRKNLSQENVINKSQENKQVGGKRLISDSNEEKRNELILQVVPTKKCSDASFAKEIWFSDKDKKGYTNEAFEKNSENLNLNESYIQRENLAVFTATQQKQKNSKNTDKIKLLKYSKLDNDIVNCVSLVKDNNKANSYGSVEQYLKPKDSESVKKENSKSLCRSFRLFYNPKFFLQMVIQGGQIFGYTLLISVMIDYARDKQISTDDAMYFITFMPIPGIFGGLCFSWITDGAYMTSVNFCTICFFILAFDVGLLIWSSDFSVLMTGYMVFGAVNGALAPIFPGMIMDNIEREQQNLALASRYTIYGILCPVKAPIVGYFRETLESYDGVYYIILGIQIFCGAIAQLIPLTEFCKQKIPESKKEVT